MRAVYRVQEPPWLLGHPPADAVGVPALVLAGLLVDLHRGLQPDVARSHDREHQSDGASRPEQVADLSGRSHGVCGDEQRAEEDDEERANDNGGVYFGLLHDYLGPPPWVMGIGPWPLAPCSSGAEGK